MEKDILNYSPTVMFRETPYSFLFCRKIFVFCIKVLKLRSSDDKLLKNSAQCREEQNFYMSLK